jgi:hypothetical protein
MYDHISILNCSRSLDHFKSLPQIEFERSYNEETFELADDRHYSFNALNLTFPNGKSRLRGSLHKFMNEGKHNHDDFPISSLITTIAQIEEHFEINASCEIINSVEFGVNIELPFDVNELLHSVICHKKKQFDQRSSSHFYFLECNRQQYTIKLYDKGRQYSLKSNILRFEIHVHKMGFLHTKGITIRSLGDLSNLELCQKLGKLLVTTYNEILFENPDLEWENLSFNDKLKYKEAMNPRYWSTHVNVERTAAAYKSKSRLLMKVQRIMRCRFQREVKHMIEAKWQQLMQT